MLQVIRIFQSTQFFLIITDDLIKVHKFKPTIKWRQSFENYLKTMPPYYIGVSSLNIILLLLLLLFFFCFTAPIDVFFPQSLRKALRIMGAPNLLAENMEYGLSYSVVSYLKKLSQQVRSLDVLLCYIWAHITESLLVSVGVIIGLGIAI